MNTFSLASVARAHIFGGLSSHFVTVRPLPYQIGQYQLMSKINKKGAFQEFLLGIYSLSGKLAVGKTWSGSHSLYYLSLKNEARVYKLLGKKVQELAHRTPRALKHINIPQLLGYQETQNSLSILIEFVDGAPLTEKSIEEKKEVFIKVLHYLRYLGENMTNYEKLKLGSRNGFSELVSYPLFCLLAIISYPRFFKTILSGVSVFLLNSPQLLKRKKLVLAHRDLHFKNILVNGANAHLLDLEYVLFALPEYDLTVVLISQWKNKIMRMFLLDELKKYNTRIATALLVKITTHYLIDRKLPEETRNNYLEILKTASANKIFEV